MDHAESRPHTPSHLYSGSDSDFHSPGSPAPGLEESPAQESPSQEKEQERKAGDDFGGGKNSGSGSDSGSGKKREKRDSGEETVDQFLSLLDDLREDDLTSPGPVTSHLTAKPAPPPSPDPVVVATAATSAPVPPKMATMVGLHRLRIHSF